MRRRKWDCSCWHVLSLRPLRLCLYLYTLPLACLCLPVHGLLLQWRQIFVYGGLLGCVNGRLRLPAFTAALPFCFLLPYTRLPLLCLLPLLAHGVGTYAAGRTCRAKHFAAAFIFAYRAWPSISGCYDASARAPALRSALGFAPACRWKSGAQRTAAAARRLRWLRNGVLYRTPSTGVLAIYPRHAEYIVERRAFTVHLCLQAVELSAGGVACWRAWRRLWRAFASPAGFSAAAFAATLLRGAPLACVT